MGQEESMLRARLKLEGTYIITATSTAGNTFAISNPVSSGGGGSVGNSRCTSVEFDVWQDSCAGGLQYRNIISQSPRNCVLTSSQQADRSRVCEQEEDGDEAIDDVEPEMVEIEAEE